MIRIKKVTVKFSENTVLDNLTADFQTNKVYGIVGFNGSGKTTFFNALSNNLKVNAGEIDFGDAASSQHDIAYLETSNFFYSRITGKEYLDIFEQTNPQFDLAALNDLFQLPLDELVEFYSTGMKKKLALLGILKKQKSVFLLDEPFNGLDLETTKILELIICSLKEKGKTVFLSSHIIDTLLNVCDEIYFLANGQFVKSFTKANFHSLEEELFGKMKLEAKLVISKSI